MSFKTVKEAINFAVKQFTCRKIYFGHGTDNAWDEAVSLVLSALSLSPESKTAVLKRRLTAKECRLVLDVVAQRVHSRMPAAYLTHEAWFAGLSFYVDERVLIPRSPLAELIVNKFAPWIKPHHVKRILDIGTGSGCIAISCAKAFPQAVVDATDISKYALDVARKNRIKHRLTRRVNLIRTNVFNALRGKKYDIIISNPPYVGIKEMIDLPQEYKHEPHNALFGGEKGCEIVTKILEKAHRYLTEYGILVVEVGNSAPLIIKKYPRLPFVWLDFAYGEGEVFLLTRKQLKEFFI